MQKVLYFKSYLSSFLLFSLALSLWAQQATSTSVAPKALYKRSDAPIDQRVHDLLSRMTVEEKARQLDLYSGAESLINKRIDKTHAAASAVFLPEKAAQLWGDMGVGGIHEEGLHGFNDGTVFPAPINLAATWDPALAQKTGAAIAAEARATGVDMILAPVLDLARDPRWGRIEEDFGEDPYLSGEMGLAYVRGAQGESLTSDHSVVAEPKHFAAHGSPEGGSNTSPVHIGERELRSIMLKSFEPAIREGHAMGVMAAYHEIDGIPVTADPFLLKKILRQEWGFRGFVLSDLGAIQRLYNAHYVAATPKDAVCLAIKSGVDMQFYDFPHEVFQKALVDCVHEGTLSMAALDRAAGAVLRVKFALGLFDHPWIDPSLNASVHRSPQHLAISLQSARESMTLLKNEGHLLPLSTSVKNIAIIGPNANVARYGDYENESNGEHIGLLQGIQELVPKASITFDKGSDIASAVAKAKMADVVILGLGEQQGISGEGFDRTNLDLPDNQEALLEAVAATEKPVVLVLENGRPLTIGWAKKHLPAILEAWYPGEFGGRAIAETLFGLNNPAGRLTITFPRSTGQIPMFYNSDPSRRYKYVDDDGKPLFPFGYGLSYTTFQYDHLSVKAPENKKDDVIVTVDVTNTGNREGDEVAQLYLRHDVSSVETPSRSLKGFSRIHLKPHEIKTVVFHVPQEQLAIWNTDGKWVIEPGSFTIWVGGSSEATLTAHFVLKPY